MSYKKLLQISKPIDHDAPQAAFNSLLQDLVNLIITNNPTVQVLHKYEFGTEEWSGYPCFGDGTRALNYTHSSSIDFWVNAAPNSDVYILGKNDNNYCICLAFSKVVKNDQYTLLISCCPGLTANTTIYEKYYNNNKGTAEKTSPSIIAHEIRLCGNYAKPTNSYVEDLRKRNYKVLLPIDTVTNMLDMNVTYVSSEYGSAYRFGNGLGYADYFNLIIFKNSVDHTVFGITPASYTNTGRTTYTESWSTHHCIFDFDKPITIRENDNELKLNSYSKEVLSSLPYVDNNAIYPYCWLANHKGSYTYFGQSMAELPIIDDSHCLNGRLMASDYNGMTRFDYMEGLSVFGFKNARNQDWVKLHTIPNTWNIPKIPFGSIFLRQYYQPNGTGEKLNLWLAFTPLEAPSLDYTQRLVGDIFTIPDGRKFMRLLPGLTTPVLRVE